MEWDEIRGRDDVRPETRTNHPALWLLFAAVTGWAGVIALGVTVLELLQLLDVAGGGL